MFKHTIWDFCPPGPYVPITSVMLRDFHKKALPNPGALLRVESILRQSRRVYCSPSRPRQVYYPPITYGKIGISHVEKSANRTFSNILEKDPRSFSQHVSENLYMSPLQHSYGLSLNKNILNPSQRKDNLRYPCDKNGDGWIPSMRKSWYRAGNWYGNLLIDIYKISPNKSCPRSQT
jgi:hypothetical protein